MEKPFYQLTALTPQGKVIPMSDYKGKVVLIVNTATKCGLAPQFEGLEELHKKHSAQGLIVLGFPCDQFAGQEPESNETIEQVCMVNHGVTFQLLAKCDVNGADTHPIFRYLKKQLSGFISNRIKWNFTKFVIDKNGQPFKRYAPTTKPKALEKDLIKLLQS
ncbi:glutathione peroxidase [Sphingobacterium spiritivorum]|uniref:glutathione peroxidase n=1 Tax=Sphingobacterium spiritivorum TaxID=258 RepID=UPI003DA374B8